MILSGDNMNFASDAAIHSIEFLDTKLNLKMYINYQIKTSNCPVLKPEHLFPILVTIRLSYHLFNVNTWKLNNM